MDANVPFEKAVKRLFRHLHDARALSRNPIVRNVFDNQVTGGFGEDRSRAVLGRIHQLVRQGADYCRNEDLARGKEERARRQHAIILRQCLRSLPISQVAAEIGISVNTCYRERADICRRVARYIGECDELPVLDYLAELDEFRSLVDRTVPEVTAGNIETSFRHCDALIRAASTTEQRVEALCLKALVSLVFGNVRRAEGAFSTAKIVLAGQLDGNTSLMSDLSRAWIDLTGCMFAQYRGDSREAVRSGKLAAAGLEPLLPSGSVHIKELYLQSVLEVGIALWNLGDRDHGYEYIVRAEANLHHPPGSLWRLRGQLAVTLWKYRSRLLMSSKAWYPAWERLRGLTTAFEEAYASGSLTQAIDALVVITECNALAGHKVEALRAAELAVSLANQNPSENVRAQVSIDVAAKLMRTDYWEEALTFFSEVKRVDSCAAFYRANAEYVVAARALRLHRFQEAWRLANVSDGTSGYADLTLMKRLIAAAAAYELGWHQKSRAIVESVIPEAEVLGSAPILRDAYEVAAKGAGGDPRFRRKARELSRLLAL
jgi:hypothetical protein